MKIRLTFLMLLSVAILSAQAVVDFEEFNLAGESYLNGEDGNGGFSSGDVFLPNEYNATWGSWSGWAISNTTDVTTPGYLNQYSAITGSGFDGSAHYAVSYVFGNTNIILQGEVAGQVVPGMYITNSTYAYLSMRDGDSNAKKFGGLTGNDEDYFLLTIKAYSEGELSADSVNFYLADFRFEDNTQDYIVDEWTWADLSSLGAVDSLTFTLTSTDVGQFGMNTPAYFCVDDIFAADPTSSTSSVVVDDLFEVYPNPTTDYIQVAYLENEIMNCTIFDVNGKLLLQQQLDSYGGQIDLQFLPRGSYWVSVAGEKVRSAQLVVKQ